ncbi:uncharacterized protein LOC132273165 [Cornus florida]|uniref:uncharacterized protein LOC132273165 n=1 Tax=Cornus florida TaxID=4283 RepID=UPI00289A19B9|nr:uncharacterized protein LOC132273165 [Cornus florida]
MEAEAEMICPKIHRFALMIYDCIGSEFNIKGAMQCPNCRVTENGEWRFATGGSDSNIDYTDEDEPYPVPDMNPPATDWYPFNGFSEAPPRPGGGIIVRTANEISEDVLNIFGGASNPLVYPWNVPQGYQMPASSMNVIQHHHQSWTRQVAAPFPSMGYNIPAADQPFNSPPIFEFSGTFSYRAPSPGSSAPAAIHNPWSTPAGAWGSVGTSSGLPYPGSNGPPLTRPRIPSQQLQSNSPSPAVLASMLRRRRNSDNQGL